VSITLSLPDRPVFGLSDSELLTHLADITVAERQLAAARLETVAELCARGIPAARGYAHPVAFLREHLKVHPGAAGQMHRLATTLPHLPALSQIADALAKGAISETQAAVITTAIQAITAEATPQQQTQAAALLLSQAAVLAPKELALCGNRILHHVAPQTAEQRDRAHLEAAERSAWQARAFTLSPDGHGRYRLRGSTTAEGAALLHTILDPLTHPRHHTPDNTSECDTSSSNTSSSDTNGSGSSGTGTGTGSSDPHNQSSDCGNDPNGDPHGDPNGDPRWRHGCGRHGHARRRPAQRVSRPAQRAAAPPRRPARRPTAPA